MFSAQTPLHRDLVRFVVGSNLDVEFTAHAIIVAFFILGVFVYALINIFKHRLGLSTRFDIDEATFGIGQQTFTLRPNDTDRQIAYQIWVELSTRKIGLEIDPDDDVIAEIYDSWHTFFTVTRDLIKDVPVSRIRRRDTEKIIQLSIDVLNVGLRPHLTKWQARFRRWYGRQLDNSGSADLAPQDIQKQYPGYRELIDDLLIVNQRLIAYRAKMKELIGGA